MGSTSFTAKYSGPQAAFGTGLSSFGDGYGEHVVYIGADQHVHQLYTGNANQRGVDQDLTGKEAKPVEESKVPPAAVGSALSSLTNNLGELIFYISADQHVHLLVFANGPPGIPPLAVACPAASSGEVGVLYSSTIGVSGGVAPFQNYNWSATWPPGLTLDIDNGTISGIPTTPGTYNITVSVTDATGTTATSADCQITVVGGPTVACPPSGEVGVPYNTALMGSGGTPLIRSP